MRLTILLTCFFMTCGPFLVEGQKKMVFVIPRVVRRAHSPHWRQYIRPTSFSKSPQYLENESRSHPKSYPYPHHKFSTKGRSVFFNQNEAHSSNGDDFARGHEKVNHVVIPHGKGITHAVTYGRGYIPHDSFKDHQPSFTEVPASHGSVEDNELNYYPHTHVAPQPTHNYLQQQQPAQDDVDKDSSYQRDSYENIQDRGTDDYKPKYFTSKPYYSKLQYDFPKKQFYHSESFFNKDKFAPASKEIPQINFSENKGGVILKETVDLSEYQNKLIELAKNWPATVNASPLSALSTDSSGNTYSGIGDSSQPVSSNSFQPSNYPIGNILASFSFSPQQQQQQQQTGYAVKEDIQDVPHDFRTQPIQTAPPATANPQDIYQAAVPQIQHIIPQQSYSQMIPYGYQNGASGLLQG